MSMSARMYDPAIVPRPAPDGQSPRFSILVVGRLKDHKMKAKLQPLLAMEEVAEVALVRRTPLPLPGVRSYCPPRGLRDIAALAELWRLLTVLWICLTRRPSFVVSFYLLPHALYADLARRLFGVATIPVTISEEDVKLGVSRRPFTSALRAARAVGVRGRQSARILEARGVPAAKIFSPPNLYDPADYAPDPAVPKDIDVLFVGNLVAVKRLERLLEAVALLSARRPDLRVSLVGDGVLRRELEEKARSLGVSGHVRFEGARPFEEVVRWLRRARLLVMTSEMEGLPQAMIEAMSCGVPVVIAETGDVATLARHGENAWIVPEATAAAFAEAIDRLLGDDALYARLVEGCLALRDRFRRDYGLEAAIAEWRRAFGAGTSGPDDGGGGDRRARG
jgi:glycosyltransferase involved in cell wall biosynthesis